jgi:hypothetical protein
LEDSADKCSADTCSPPNIQSDRLARLKVSTGQNFVMAEADVKTRVALLGVSKSVPKPSRSYALQCGLLSSDLLSNPSLQSTVQYRHLSHEELQVLISLWSKVHSKKCPDPQDPDRIDIESLLAELYITDSEYGRLKNLVEQAPNLDEIYRVFNRFGQRSLANHNEVSKVNSLECNCSD